MLAGEARLRQGLPASVPYDPDGLPEPHPLELARDRDPLSSFVRPCGLARMAAFNAIAVAVSAGCAWLLAPAFSAGPGVIAIAGLLTYSAVDIAVAVALRDGTSLMLVGKVSIAFFGSTDRGCALARDRDGHER